MVAEDRMKREAALAREDALHGYATNRYTPEHYNTLGPNEDVIARRRATKRRPVYVPAVRQCSPSHLLMENIVLLLFLVASIYGLYRLCIFILNQA